MKTNFHPQAFEGMARGIKLGAEAVAPTLGIGSNVIIEKKLYPYHIVTNDANSIIQALEVEDAEEKRGLGFLKEGATATTSQSGDGRTTMVLLLDAILQHGIELLQQGTVKHLDLKKSLQECLPLIEQSLKDQSREISVDEVDKVAAIAGEDEEIARILKEIYQEIGKEGFIEIESLGNFKSSWKLIDGVQFVDTGYASESMVYDEEARKLDQKEKRAIYHKPLILLTKRKIDLAQEINPLLGYITSPEYIAEYGKQSLIIFASDMNSDVVRMMVDWQTNPARTLNILIVKAPTMWQPYVYEDLAKLTGATIVEDATGVNFKNLQIKHLGTCETFICDKTTIRVLGGKDVTNHVQALKEEGSEDAKRRIAWLTQKNATIMLGADSDSELSYRKLKCEDAIHSSQRALQSGIVTGGGIALAKTREKLPLDTMGGAILHKALKRPNEQIKANAGMAYSEEVVDAREVVLGSVRNAIAIASMMLTAPAYIELPEEKQAPQASPFPFN